MYCLKLLSVDIKAYGDLTLLDFRVFLISKEIIVDFKLIGMSAQGKTTHGNQKFIILFHCA